jgi:monofunctional biosynthetic peptidoglycan transglycosylase
MGKGVYGIEAAAHHYFNKPAKNLTRQESAMIAACLPNPKIYTIKPLHRHVLSRYPWILVQMSHLQDDPDIQKLLQ